MSPLAKNILKALALMSVAFVGWIFWSFNTCALDLGDGDRVMQEELKRAGLDAKFLSPGKFSDGSCTVSYSYRGGGQELDYVVLDDPLHGPKLTLWDHARDASGELP